jgi:hypothetical protein
LSSKKGKHRPLLYIDQPEVKFPTVIMQEVYSIKVSSHKETNYLQKEKAPLSDLEAADYPNLAEESTEESAEQNILLEKVMEKELEESSTPALSIEDVQEQAPALDSSPFDTKRKYDYSFRRVKNFKDLDIDEKLLYLENFPEQLSPVSCLYITPDTTYIGILTNNDGEAIEVQLRNGSSVALSKSDIQEIRMLGFN